MRENSKFEEALAHLITKGEELSVAIQRDCFGDDVDKQVLKVFGEEEGRKYLKNLPDFKKEYQSWYSEAQTVIKQILPDRLADFISYYEYPRARKDISFQNYMIRDYLQGLKISRGHEVVADSKAAIPEFEQQLGILKAAKKTLKSSLRDITAILQADLFDSEVESARALLHSGFLRAAGAICGVVIEKHLKKVCVDHKISVRKKKPAISDLSQLLRDNDVLDIPQWRYIQHLADLRNISDHARERDPTKDDISDLVSGTDKILKTVF